MPPYFNIYREYHKRYDVMFYIDRQQRIWSVPSGKWDALLYAIFAIGVNINFFAGGYNFWSKIDKTHYHILVYMEYH